MAAEQSPVVRAQSEQEFEAYYDERFEHGYMTEWPIWRRRRIGDFVREMALPATGRVLDFGCGQGVFTAVLQSTLPGWEVWGSDLSTVGLREAARRFPRCRFAVGTDVASHGPFDLIFTHHVLEHVGDLDAIIALLAGMLTPAGRMIHILPCGNEGSFEHGLCRLRDDGIDVVNGRFFFDEEGHVRRLTTATLSAAVAPHGFALAQQAYASQFWGALDRISDQELETIAGMFDARRGVDDAARGRLTRLRVALTSLRLLKRPPAVLLRGRVREVLARADWNWRDKAVLAASNPLFLVSFPLRALLRRLANREWERRRMRPGGSEMYLVFRRASQPAR